MSREEYEEAQRTREGAGEAEAATRPRSQEALSEDARGPEGASAVSAGGASRLRAVWANPGYRFVILFLPYLGLISYLYPLFAKHYRGVVQGMIMWTTSILYHIFALFTDEIRVSNKLLLLDRFMVKIVDECTGIYEVIIFTAAVFAFPTSLKNKVIGIVCGNLFIYVFNLLRIVMLMLVGVYFPSVFDFMHMYFWQGTMILMIASVWLLWIVKVVQRGATDSSPGG